MKKNIRFLLTALLCCILNSVFLFACSQQQPQVNSVEFTTETLSEQIETEDGKLLLTVEASYPIFTTDVESEIISEFNQRFKEKAELYLQEILETYLQDGSADNVMQFYLANQEHFQSYGFALSPEVTYQQNGILSMIWSQYSYLSGAHGYTAFDGETYDLNTGELLSLGDLLEMKDDEAYKMIEQRYQGVLQAYPDNFYPESAAFVSENIQNIEYYLSADAF